MCSVPQMYTAIYAYMHVWIHTHIYIYIYTHVYICNIYIYVYTYIHPYVCIYIYIYVYVYICKHPVSWSLSTSEELHLQLPDVRCQEQVSAAVARGACRGRHLSLLACGSSKGRVTQVLSFLSGLP